MAIPAWAVSLGLKSIVGWRRRRKRRKLLKRQDASPKPTEAPMKIRKRLTTLIVTGVVAPLMLQFGVPENIVTWLVTLAMAYIGGQSLSDAAAANAGTKKNV